MKLLFVTSLDPCIRSVATVCKYVEAGRHFGHEVAIFGEPHPQLPTLPYSVDATHFDYTVFVIHVPNDFPDVPALPRLLDTVPRERRIVIDCWGRYNETIRVGHDFNHLEKVDGHLGWEWIDAFQSVAATVLQPTMSPRRDDVQSFLFHAFDPAAVVRPYESPRQAAKAWSGTGKPYGMIYVGNNWQRWEQVRALLEALQPIRERLGSACLIGWDWDRRPDWAVQNGIKGIDVDPEFLGRWGVETRGAVRFDAVAGILGQARFSPVIHRPLFLDLGFVTNRTFETFCADTLPLLLLPEDLVKAVYGPAALALVPGADVTGRVEDMMRRPEPYWEAVLKTREYLAQQHSFERRLQELEEILKGPQCVVRPATGSPPKQVQS